MASGGLKLRDRQKAQVCLTWSALTVVLAVVLGVFVT